MGKGFSLKGCTGVKECLAFQTPNPLPAVWNAGLCCSIYACPHTHKHVPLTYSESLCPACQQSQVVVIDCFGLDWKRLKINVCLAQSASFSMPYVEKA